MTLIQIAKQSLLLAFFCMMSIMAYSQTNRFLQHLQLTQSENLPLYSNTYSLPHLALKGIESGEITPYDIDYNKGIIRLLTQKEYKQRLTMEIINDEYEGLADTIFFLPIDFYQLQVDLIKRDNKIEKINYIHFCAPKSKTPSKHGFSVPFSELANFLNQQNSLWITNSNSMIWKDQITHTDGLNTSDILIREFPDSGYHFIHLQKDDNNKYATVQLYNTDHQMLNEQPYSNFLPTNTTAEIMPMSEALMLGMYTFDSEKKLKNKAPEDSGRVEPVALRESFMTIHHEEIYLDHPANAKFFMEEKELSTLIMNAVEKGKLQNIYATHLLNTRITLEEWHQNASAEIVHYKDVENEKDMLSKSVTYDSRSVSVVSVSWEKYFNSNGEIIAKLPHSIGLSINGKHTPSGLNKTIGYFKFNDVYHTLKHAPEANYDLPEPGNYLNDLLKENYFSYWTATSGLTVPQ